MDKADIILNSIGGLSYGGLFLIALMANFIIPIPEEIVLLAVGYLTSLGIFMYPMTMAIFILGMLTSDYVLYSLSYVGSRFVRNLRLKLQKRGYMKNEAHSKRNIKKIIFFSRFLVYLRFIGPIVSGSLKVKRKIFLTYDFLALVIYVNIFLWMGNFFHKQIFLIENGVSKFIHYFLTIIIIVITIAALRFLQKNFLNWFSKMSDYISTIIPGLEQKDPKDND